MALYRKREQVPGLIFQPHVYESMQRGMGKIVSAVRPTLGPIHRTVIIEKESYRDRPPELLDDGALIARRIIQLANRDEDMGAMYLRQMLWGLHESVGDGTATATVIFEKILNGGILYITSGGNATRLREALENAIPMILDELKCMTFMVEGKEALSRLAQSICYDPELARMLGEIFDVIGEFGRLEIQTGRGRSLEREYIEGMFWSGAILSREMIPDPQLGRVKLEDVAILITNLEISEPSVMQEILEKAVQSNIRSLLLVARTISPQALALMMLKQNQEKVHAIAAKTPGLSADDHREAWRTSQC